MVMIKSQLNRNSIRPVLQSGCCVQDSNNSNNSIDKQITRTSLENTSK